MTARYDISMCVMCDLLEGAGHGARSLAYAFVVLLL